MTDIIFAILWPPLYTTAGLLTYRMLARHRRWLVMLPGTAAMGFISAGLGLVLGYGFDGKWPIAVIGAGWAGIGCLLWRYRRKRKRAAALLGAKSRALRDALVRVMRRERRPSRVLKPHPVPS